MHPEHSTRIFEVETVSESSAEPFTSLKRGVNEKLPEVEMRAQSSLPQVWHCEPEPLPQTRRMKPFRCVGIFLALFPVFLTASAGELLTYKGKSGPGRGQHIVFLAGDEEYRSEEALPMMAKILAVRHGFRCTVLFSINPKDGAIDPNTRDNTPGIKALDGADLCFMSLRFRELPDAQMKHFVDFLNRGKPIVALRTSTHAFSYEKNKQSDYVRFHWQAGEWPGGFGQQVLGETWVNHHGDHGKQSTRGVINDTFKSHPILRGVKDVWGPTDVYGVAHLPPDAQVLMWGQVLTGMKPTDPALAGKKNEPMMPLVWLREYTGEGGKTSRIVTTTMGAAVDLESEGLRRLLVNACYWAVGLEKKIPAKANVNYVGEYQPTWFGFGTHKRGMRPEDFALR